MQTPLGFRRQRNPVAADELKQPQHHRRIAFELRGTPQKNSFARNREFAVGKARTPVAEIPHQRALGLLQGAQRPARMVEDHTRRAGSIRASIWKSLATRDRESLSAAKQLGDNLLLCFHVQQIAVALGVVMQKASHRGKELTGLTEFVAVEFIANVSFFAIQARQPSDQIPIAESAGRLLDIGLAVVHRVLKLGVPHVRMLGKMLAQLRAVLLQERRPLVLETRIQRVVARQIA